MGELAGLPDKYIHQPWKCPPTILKRNNVNLGVNYPQRCIIDLDKAREASLNDVIQVREKYGKQFIDPKYGRDMVPIKFAALGLKGPKSKKDVVMIPLITRKEFIYKTARPENEDNPYNPVLKGYVSRGRDEEVARLNRVDFTASTMKGSFGGRGRPQRRNVRV